MASPSFSTPYRSAGPPPHVKPALSHHPSIFAVQSQEQHRNDYRSASSHSHGISERIYAMTASQQMAQTAPNDTVVHRFASRSKRHPARHIPYNGQLSLCRRSVGRFPYFLAFRTHCCGICNGRALQVPSSPSSLLSPLACYFPCPCSLRLVLSCNTE